MSRNITCILFGLARMYHALCDDGGVCSGTYGYRGILGRTEIMGPLLEGVGVRTLL